MNKRRDCINVTWNSVLNQLWLPSKALYLKCLVSILILTPNKANWEDQTCRLQTSSYKGDFGAGYKIKCRSIQSLSVGNGVNKPSFPTSFSWKYQAGTCVRGKEVLMSFFFSGPWTPLKDLWPPAEGAQVGGGGFQASVSPALCWGSTHLPGSCSVFMSWNQPRPQARLLRQGRISICLEQRTRNCIPNKEE